MTADIMIEDELAERITKSLWNNLDAGIIDANGIRVLASKVAADLMAGDEPIDAFVNEHQRDKIRESGRCAMKNWFLQNKDFLASRSTKGVINLASEQAGQICLESIGNFFVLETREFEDNHPPVMVNLAGTVVKCEWDETVLAYESRLDKLGVASTQRVWTPFIKGNVIRIALNGEDRVVSVADIQGNGYVSFMEHEASPSIENKKLKSFVWTCDDCGEQHPVSPDIAWVNCVCGNSWYRNPKSKNVSGFSDFAEAWCSGWNAHRDNGDVDAGTFQEILMERFRSSGSQMAKRAIELSDRERIGEFLRGLGGAGTAKRPKR